jgi:hypothetical protein
MSADETRSSVQEAAAPASTAEPTEPSTSPLGSGEVGNPLESIESLAPVAHGEIVKGRVLKITESEVLVDIGVK